MLPWNPGANAMVSDIQPTSSGLVACGDFTTISNQPQAHVAVMDPVPVAVGESLVPRGRLALSVSPNPFRGSARARFYLPKPGSVSLALYDPSGRRVVSTPSRLLTTGWHTIDLTAPSLATGVYWCRLEAPGGQASLKLLHLE